MPGVMPPPRPRDWDACFWGAGFSGWDSSGSVPSGLRCPPVTSPFWRSLEERRFIPRTFRSGCSPAELPLRPGGIGHKVGAHSDHRVEVLSKGGGMPASNASWVLTRAEEYFREIERLLLDLTFIRAKVRERMKSLAREYRTEFPLLRLSLYAQTREAQGEPTALYWGLFCRPPSELSLARAKGKKLYRWRTYCAGKLTSRMIFYGGGKSYKARILDYDRRARILNKPYHILTKALLSIEHPMLNRRQGAAWESGGPEVPAPRASPNLRPEDRKSVV